jgi:integrase
MPSTNLTAAFVSQARPVDGRTTEYRDAKTPGLALRVTPRGSRSWTLRYRTHEGVQRRYTIGPYPAVSLASAREQALAVLTQAASGGDPAKAKKAARQTATASRLHTIGDLAERYFDDAAKGRHRPKGKPKRPSTLKMDRYYYHRLVAPAFGSVPIAEPRRADIQTFINRIADEHSPSSANQCRNVLRQMFTYAVFLELIPANPCTFVDGPSFTTRERVLSDDELRLIWTVCEDPASVPGLHMSHAMGIAIQLALVTLQRRAEAACINMAEIDFEKALWTIPGDRTKNKRTHIVPLSDLALTLIREAIALCPHEMDQPYAGYLFPSPRKADTCVDPHALTRSFSRLTEATDIQNARLHDLRRTGATHLTGEGLSVSRFIVSQVLNHISDTGGAAAVTSVYDRNAYLREKRRALDAWAKYLTALVFGETVASNVVHLSGQ